MAKKIDVMIIGGGMITHDLLLPSIYHLQRLGVVQKIDICALDTSPLRALNDHTVFRDAFPGQSFVSHPALSEPLDKAFPDLYKQVLANMLPRQGVVVAVPDQFHYPVVLDALRANQHVLCVKPFVLEYKQAIELEKLAHEKGLFVGVEYHKRFDRRSLIAKREYELGNVGDFVMGEAKLIEPYYYRSSNFQNWFTWDRTDPFVYIGCHYVDLVQFITGLKPIDVSVAGIKGKFPNGNIGYLWAHGRVIYENGALLSVIDGLGYPDDGAGSNDQCLSMFFEGSDNSGLIKHDDQFRGVSHCYLKASGSTSASFKFVNPDFFRLVPWEREGYKPIGYGYDSVAASILTMQRIGEDTAELSDQESLRRRRQLIDEVDKKGIIATPANSCTNELVMEAARISILNEGKSVKILYGKDPHVEMK
jgi:D-galacturonate reductase